MRSHRTGLIALSLVLLAGCRMMTEDQTDVLSHVAGMTVRAIVRASTNSAQDATSSEPAVHHDVVVISRDRASLDPASNVIRRCASAAAEVAVPSVTVRQTTVVRVCAVTGKRTVERVDLVIGNDGFVPAGDSTAKTGDDPATSVVMN